MCNHVLITASCTEDFIIKALVDSESNSDEKFVYLLVIQAVVEEMIGAQYREWQRGDRDPFHAQILTKFTRHVLNQSLSEKPQGNEIFTTKHK